jgi:hypothetical protein
VKSLEYSNAARRSGTQRKATVEVMGPIIAPEGE